MESVESIISGKEINGFSGAYSTGSIATPEVEVTKKYLEELYKKDEEIKKQKSQCKKITSPDFENMFPK